MSIENPWGDRFINARILEVFNVQGDPQSGRSDNVPLTRLEQNPTLLFVSVTAVCVLRIPPAREALQRASKQLANKYPVLTGRFNSSGTNVVIECNNRGFPLSFVLWPEGEVDAFPEALTFKGWKAGKFPTPLPPPIFVDSIEGMGAVFDQQPMCSLRVTTLGRDGGCVVTFTANHALCDGLRLQIACGDFLKACRGEPLTPLPKGVSRDLVTARGLAKGKEMEEEQNFAEAYARVFGSGCIPHWPVDEEEGNIYGKDLAYVIVNIPRSDLGNLKEAVQAGTGQHVLSTNDVLVGLTWALRARIARKPLPGQEGSQADIAFLITDFLGNALPDRWDQYFGCTTVGIPVQSPSPGLIKFDPSKVKIATLADRELLEAVAAAAVSNRRTILDFRRKRDYVGLLNRFVEKNRLRKEKGRMQAAAAAGMRVRNMLSNLDVFHRLNNSDAQLWDGGTGPAVWGLVYMDRATRSATLVPSRDGSSLLLQLFLPTAALEALRKSLVALLPGATVISSQ